MPLVYDEVIAELFYYYNVFSIEEPFPELKQYVNEKYIEITARVTI